MSEHDETTAEQQSEETVSDTDKQSANKHKQSKPKATVLVDAYFTTLELSVQRGMTGLQLFEQVASLLNVREVWFFGLQFKDTKGVETWLKLKKNVFDQPVGKRRPIQMGFRAKFYPEDIGKELDHPVARRLFYEQVKDSILNSSLYCPVDTAVLLASYSLQENHGHYNTVLQPAGFLAEETLLPQKLTSQYELSPQEWEDKVVAFYKDHRSLNKEQAILEYLNIAQDLEMFGVDYFPIKNKKGTELCLGLDALGLNVYENDNRLAPKLGFPWHEIKILSYKDKRFTITPVDDKAPEFVFTVGKTHMNKQILTLSMGNHELYIRRRKVDVAPERSSLTRKSAVVGDRDMKKKSYRVSEVCPDLPIIAPSRSSQGHAYEDFGQDDQANEGTLPIERVKSHKVSDMSAITTGGPYEQIEDKPQPETAKRVSIMETSPKENVYQRIASVYQEQDGVAVESPDSHVLEEHEVLDSQTQLSDQEGDDEHQTSQVHYDYTDEQDLDGMPEYAAVLPRKSSIAKEDTIPERRRYVPRNPDTYKRVKDLFEEMSDVQTEWTKEHSFYQQILADGMDKYQTLKHIRSGFARDRIALFEAL